jgi:anti-anti-sigma factor
MLQRETRDVTSTSAFEFEVVDGQPTVRGDLDVSNAVALQQQLLHGHDEARAVDFSGVTSFDSSALRAVLQAVDEDPRLRIVNPSAVVTRVLRKTHTYDHLVDDLT